MRATLGVEALEENGTHAASASSARVGTSTLTLPARELTSVSDRRRQEDADEAHRSALAGAHADVHAVILGFASGDSAGTTTLPCLVVTSISPREACAGVLSKLAMPGPGIISTFSTGAQSMLWQHSIGYQSCAAAGVAAASRAGRSHFLDMEGPRLDVRCSPLLPLSSVSPQSEKRQSLDSVANGMPKSPCAVSPTVLWGNVRDSWQSSLRTCALSAAHLGNW